MFSTSKYARSWAVVACLALFTTMAAAQLPVPPSSQFDVDGFLEVASLSGATPTSGGSMTVNGHVITVPANTIVILPANALTWEELFAQAPAPYTGVATGMALADVPMPLTTYEAHVIGNRVGDTYIAGLIYLSQQDLNSGQGFINFIDYSLGEMRIGGVIGDSTTGTRVRINDPAARFSMGLSPDVRFTVDADNPTIASGTGFPMCLPREAPGTVNADGTVGDQLCPEGNRPLIAAGGFASSFFMPDPATLAVGQFPDPRIQAPFEVGDWVSYAGTLVSDTTGIAGPWPGPLGVYVSAHTITNNIAIYTSPNTNPAYVSIDTFIMGTGGLTVLGAGEAAIRTRFEGMATDPSRAIHLYGIDVASDGTISDRDWGMVGIDPGPPTGAVMGRWRFRPPCTATISTISDKQCSPPPSGSFLPPTREVRAVIVAKPGSTQQNAWTFGQTTTYANGIIAGQYHAPILEYIFPENVPGAPVVENNFNAMPFLACGGYKSSTGVLAGQLNPWPSNVIPSLSNCTNAVVPPSITVSAIPNPVAGGALVTLNAVVGGTSPSVVWTQAAADPVQVLLSGANTTSATFTAPLLASTTTLNFTATATNSAGSASASVAVAVDQVAAPTVSYTPANPITVSSGQPVTLTGSCVDPNGLPCSMVWTQTNAGAVGVPTVLNPNPDPVGTISFTVTLPLGTISPVTIQLQLVGTNSLGVSSSPDFTSVTINPPVDAINITSVEYRTSKQRLIVNASDSIISPNIVLLLQPYLTEQGTTYNPDPAAGGVGNVFVNNGGGLYILDMVGAPAPACNLGGTYATPCSQTPIVVKSNIGGTSQPSAVTKIRQ